MRKSNKKRKLEHIREKNYYRLGGSAMLSFKMSKELLNNMDEASAIADFDISKLEKKYKLNFKASNLKSSMCGDDFIRGLITTKVTLKAVQNE